MICYIMAAPKSHASGDPLCDGAYKVAVDFLPQRLNPRRNRVNVDHFLNLQIYDPLIVRTAHGLSSAFVDVALSRPNNIAFTRYTLCLREDVKFWDGTRVEAEDLAKSLADIHREGEPFAPVTEIETKGRCVEISLQRSDPDYLDKLTVVASTVVKSGTEGERLPVGHGPYKPISWSRDTMTLEHRSGPQADVDFPKIEVRRFTSTAAAISANFADINMLNWEVRKSRAVPTERYRRVNAPRNRSYALIVSVPDASLRKQITGCFDRKAFLSNFPMELREVPGWIPMQMLGSNVYFDDVQAAMRPASCAFSPRGELPFLYQIDDMEQVFQTFTKAQNGRLPVHLQLRKFDRGDMIKIFTSHENQIFLAGVDALSAHAGRFSEPAIFFDVFVDPVRFTQETMTHVGRIADRAAASITRESKQVLYLQAHRALLETGYLIPLGELPDVVYYPKCIKEIEFADPVTSYPRIDRLRKER